MTDFPEPIKKQPEAARQPSRLDSEIANPSTLYRRRLTRQLVFMGLILGGIIIIVGALGYTFSNQIKSIRDSRAEREYLIKSLDSIAKLSADKDLAERYKKELARIYPIAIEVPVKVLPHIRNLAEIQGVAVSIQISSERAGISGGPNGLGFSLYATGLTGHLIDFLAKLENSVLLQASSWELRPSANTQGKYELRVDGVIFIQPS
ncbi:MAG: hypothetical protein AAB686_00675 [Patescibacteria group bacterium]